MNKLLESTFILIIILFASCEKRISDLEFEKIVMTEILPSLIDSTCVDTRLFTNPPPLYGKYIYDKNGVNIKIDTSKATEGQRVKMREWKQNEQKIKNDTSKIIIAFNPKIKFNNEDVEIYFENHFKGAKIQKAKAEDSPEYVFDFKNIKLNGKFKLKDISEFPKRYKIWGTKYDFVFSGVAYFTKIQFDKDKKFGILNGGFVCGGKCGQGFRIYIKKVNKKWLIDKIDGTWIS
jgi:hypothetical protein